MPGKEVFFQFKTLIIEYIENNPVYSGDKVTAYLVKKFEDYVFKMEEKLPEIHELIKESQGDAQQVQSIIDKAQGMLPKAKQTNE